jgi:hypothetical protein
MFLSVYWSVYVNMQRDILLFHTILYLYLYLSVMTYLPKNQLAFSAVLPLWLSTPLQIHRYIFEIRISLKTRIQLIDEKCCAVCMACKMFMSSELCLVFLKDENMLNMFVHLPKRHQNISFPLVDFDKVLNLFSIDGFQNICVTVLLSFYEKRPFFKNSTSVISRGLAADFYKVMQF